MTYIPTKEGTLYLAVNIDVFSRKIVGWSMSSSVQDKLVRDCFLQACGKEHDHPGLIVHTDQGRQYTSSRYQSPLRQVGAQSSMSRKGNPYDDAMMESFYKTLKREKLLNTLRPITTQKGYIQRLITSLQKTLKNIILKFS